MHPGFDVKAGGESGVGGGRDGVDGDVKLDVIGVAMELETVSADDVTEGEQVQDEEEGTKHRTLGDALGQGSGGGGAMVDVYELMTVGEI